MIRIAILTLTLVLAGCAAVTPPPYLCFGGRTEDGRPPMVCQPVPEDGRK